MRVGANIERAHGCASGECGEQSRWHRSASEGILYTIQYMIKEAKYARTTHLYDVLMISCNTFAYMTIHTCD
jgi:hypothetical protein